MKFKRMIDEFRLDATYNFQTYPIIALPDNLCKAPKESCNRNCMIRQYCTLHTPYIVEKKIDFSVITAKIPAELCVPVVYWAHTGQCSFEEMFKVWYEDDRTKVYAQNQRAALRIRRNAEGFVEFASFEFENPNSMDIDFISYLSETLQKCTEHQLYLCTKGEPKKNAELLPLHSDMLQEWLIGKGENSDSCSTLD